MLRHFFQIRNETMSITNYLKSNMTVREISINANVFKINFIKKKNNNKESSAIRSGCYFIRHNYTIERIAFFRKKKKTIH